jgi:NAD-dependent DNA ligase/DNA polymerase/3'-5' exonuclease PolX
MNTQLMDILDQMADMRAKEGEQFKARAFKTAYDTLAATRDNITSPRDLKGLAGFGPSVTAICTEYMQTGRVAVLEAFKQSPVNVFAEIYGIGPKMAAKLVEKDGIQTLDQLRAASGRLLNEKQRIGLEYYDDIKARIPRAIIVEYEAEFRRALPAGAEMSIVGSYRRGALTSGDIDVIFTVRNSNVTQKETTAAFGEFISAMVQRGLIRREHILASGTSKCLVLARLASDDKYRRVDFLCTPRDEYAAALIYFTGSKYFNTVMRQWALDSGYTMNEHGVYRLTPDREKGARVDVEFKTEADIFGYLGLVWREPVDRRDGRDVVGLSTVLVDKLRAHGAGSLTRDEKAVLIAAAKDAYYNQGAAILTDAEYDILEDAARAEGVTVGVGAAPDANIVENVRLPYLAPSLDKIKPETGALEKWRQKWAGAGAAPAVVSCKLDGCSLIYYVGADGTPALYTRGDGQYGTDVSRLLPYLSHTLGTGAAMGTRGICVRGELIMKKSVFEGKYATKYANIRNMIAGVFRKTAIDRELMSDIDFVPYEVIAKGGSSASTAATAVPIAEQFRYLMVDLRWAPVWHNAVCAADLTAAHLSEMLVIMRKEYQYEIDGLVVVSGGAGNKRPTVPDKNPDYAFAFKMVLDDQKAEVTVTDVVWSVSKDGYLKPTIMYTPTILGGAECTNVTGINGRFILENRLGVGAIITVIRSGDVIPKVLLPVIAPAMVVAAPDCEYHWVGPEMVADNLTDNAEMAASAVLYFFKSLGVDYVAESTVGQLAAAGYNTVPLVLNMTEADWLALDRVGKVKAAKLWGAVQKVGDADLVAIMSASNMFGRGVGEKKLRPIMLEYPSALWTVPSIAQLLGIKGVGSETAAAFIAGVAAFREFMEQSPLLKRVMDAYVQRLKSGSTMAAVAAASPQKEIVVSGFRDKGFTEWCAAHGVTVVDGMKKSVAALVVKDPTEVTGKTQYAEKNGIPIMTVAQFRATVS